MSQNKPSDGGLSTSALVFGFLLGLIAGGMAALFGAPRSGAVTRQQLADTGQALRSKLDHVVPADPVAESIAEGKAAARRRRAELGTDIPD